MNYKGENGVWHFPQPGIQWIFKELHVSLVRPEAGICSLSAEIELQAQKFIKIQEPSPWTNGSLIQPLLCCFSLQALAWLSSYCTFSTSSYPEIACKVVK